MSVKILAIESSCDDTGAAVLVDGKVLSNHIANQKEHHKKVSFQDEYHKILRDFGVDFDERYTFKPLE